MASNYKESVAIQQNRFTPKFFAYLRKNGWVPGRYLKRAFEVGIHAASNGGYNQLHPVNYPAC